MPQLSDTVSSFSPALLVQKLRIFEAKSKVVGFEYILFWNGPKEIVILHYYDFIFIQNWQIFICFCSDILELFWDESIQLDNYNWDKWSTQLVSRKHFQPSQVFSGKAVRLRLRKDTVIEQHVLDINSRKQLS
jgi:hypothetical protein